MRAQVHVQEASRLEALRSFGILDTPRESDFDEIVALAAQICGTPISLVSLVDLERQWFKAEVGFGANQTDLESSICAHAILEKGIFEIDDLTLDTRFQDNPLVANPSGVRFYAGTQLETEDGLPLGTLCVLDTVPRRLTGEQKSALAVLGRQVMTQLELRKKVRELKIAQIEKIESEEKATKERDFVRFVTDNLPVRISYVDRSYRYLFANDAYESQLGVSHVDLLGRTIADSLGDEVFQLVKPYIDRALNGETFSTDLELPYTIPAQRAFATFTPDVSVEGEVLGVVVHMVDVTEQRNVAEALALERAYLDRVLDTARVAVWRWEIPTKRLLSNSPLSIRLNRL